MALVEEKKQLLQELRIERGQREQYTESNPRRTGLIVGIVVGGAVAGRPARPGYYFLLRKPAFEVEQATAVAAFGRSGRDGHSAGDRLCHRAHPRPRCRRRSPAR